MDHRLITTPASARESLSKLGAALVFLFLLFANFNNVHWQNFTFRGAACLAGAGAKGGPGSFLPNFAHGAFLLMQPQYNFQEQLA